MLKIRSNSTPTLYTVLYPADRDLALKNRTFENVGGLVSWVYNALDGNVLVENLDMARLPKDMKFYIHIV